jgi:serine/threonine protein kinase/mono/diheme cytochrome c family protein
MRADSVSASGVLNDLLVRWQEQRKGGGAPSPAELCADHPALASELARRIAAFESMERMLGVGPDPTAEQPAADPRAVPAHLADKLRPLGYEVVELIDHGGMGVVYKATQIDLRRTVALKMIAGLRVGPKQLMRFRLEAEAVARLEHPNVVQIYDVGEVDGHWYFSMEYVGGGTLAHRLANGPLPPATAAAWLERVARAVHYAHTRGIVHRDLKPANILLSVGSGQSAVGGQEDQPSASSLPTANPPLPTVPKITDFGLAKRLGADTDHTATGEVIGTPAYMAPEQALGRTGELGPACDVYALGAVLYEALTGRAPFRGNTVLETLRQVISDDPTEPRRVNPAVPRDLEAVCLKCLEKSRARRYATAEALADDLRRAQEGRPVTARPVSVLNRAARWVRRHPAWTAAAVVMALACTVTGALVVRERMRATAMEAGRADVARVTARAVEIAPQAREILHRHCFACHSGPKPDGDLVILDRASLLQTKRPVIRLGDPDHSELITRIHDGTMPPEEDDDWLPRVSEMELAILKEWILGGAPELPPEDPNNPTPPVVPRSELADQVRDIFEKKCLHCHMKEDAKKGFPLLNHTMLLTTRRLVIPGAPERSRLHEVLVAPVDDTRVKAMPPKGEERLSADKIATIRQWIEAGAPPFPHKKK